MTVNASSSRLMRTAEDQCLLSMWRTERFRALRPLPAGVYIPTSRCCRTVVWRAYARHCLMHPSASSSTPDQIPRRNRSRVCRVSRLQTGLRSKPLTFESTDGIPIQFFFVKPKGATKGLATLLWIHGGPMGMNADGWHWRWNPLLAVAQGYAVASAEPARLDRIRPEVHPGHLGKCVGRPVLQGSNVRDRCARETCRTSIRNSIMAMGGSFGGYMTNWIGTQTDRFRCLITHASIFTMAHSQERPTIRRGGTWRWAAKTRSRSLGIRPFRARPTRQKLEDANVDPPW